MKKDAENTSVRLAGTPPAWENGGTNEDGPRSAAPTAGSSRGLADTVLGDVD